MKSLKTYIQLLRFKFSRQAHIKYFPNISMLLLSPYLKTYESSVTVFDLKGMKLAANLDTENADESYIQKYIEVNLPALVYNSIYHDVIDYHDIEKDLIELEENLKDLLGDENPWAILLAEVFIKEEAISKDFLMKLPEERQIELSMTRSDYEQCLSPIINKLTGAFYLNKNQVRNWVGQAISEM